MKKFLTAFLLTCSCISIGAAVACKKDKKTDEGAARAVSFTSGEGYTFYSNVSAEGTVNEGSQLTFEVDLGAFYAGNLTVYVNDTIVNPDADGVYSYTVGTEDLSVRLEGVRKDVSNMAGSGTMEDAYVVSKPIDLVYIAEQVNKGDSHFATAAYVLGNDIDCKGAELEIIGDYSTQNSVFSGSFASGVNEAGERQRYTISNFTINAEDKNYVGLFGTVFADMSVESSGLIYGVCLDNFTINAGVSDMVRDEKSISCGGLVGYGVGANFYLCDATNGEINVVADNNYFSFVGGLVGYQQGFYNADYGVYNPTEISYSKVDVDVTVLGGVALYAGGITGFATTNYPYGATAAIHNSYALGSVTGALRSGGIVGGLGRYSVVSNCYATGEVTARSYQSADSLLLTSLDYCHTYAGGIVGYAENDTIAHDSFFNGNVSAFTVSDKFSSDYAHSDTAIGGGDAPSSAAVDAEEYIAYNCHANVNLSTSAFLTDTLGWRDYNWAFLDGKEPLINYAATEATITLTLTLKYVAPETDSTVKVSGKTELAQKYFDTSIQSLNSYNPIGSFMDSGSLPQYIQADGSTAEVVMRSYGYFFDEDCTQKVPVGYLPMRNVTLYVGFTNVIPVVGNYTFLDGSAKDLKLQLNADGTAVYDDGSTKLTAQYGYDGEKVTLNGVRLARYYDGEIVIDEQDTTSFQDENFDLKRYDLYNFAGTLKEGSLSLYDGVYFTESAPLRALKSEAIPVSPYDCFKGTWVSASTVNKYYSFNGENAWTYKQIVNERNGYSFAQVDKDVANGTYTINLAKDQITFTRGGVTYTATFENGFLQITGNGVTEVYYAENSYMGRWKGNGFDLVLSGIGNNGYGYASLIAGDGYATQLLYEESETAGVIAFYTPLKNDTKGYLYGYANYVATQNVLSFVYADGESTTGYANTLLYLYDDYYGEWVCQHPDFNGVNLDFNGLGLYSHLQLNSLKGILTLTNGNETTKVEYLLDSALSGKFFYNNKTYQITFDTVSSTIYVEIVGNTNPALNPSLKPKDEFGGLQLVDKTGTKFCDIDGRSTLDAGGSFSFEGTNYRYFARSGGYDVKTTASDDVIGSIVKEGNHYKLTLPGNVTELYVANKFMGDWAISGQYALFEIGPTDLEGVIHATFKGTPVQLTFLDSATLTFKYTENKMPYTYYVYVIPDEQTEEDVLVVSEFTNIMLGEYFICTKANQLFGTWEWKQDGGKTTLRFDGVTSGYTNGYAELILTLNHQEIVTGYYYAIRDTGIVLWSRETMAERTWYFRLDVDIRLQNDADAFLLRDSHDQIIGALTRTQVDGLYLTEAQASNGERYLFDGEGNMYLFDEDTLTDTVKYLYTIKSYNADRTATLEVVDKATAVKYSATLDYKDATNVKFILGDAISE